MYKQVIVMRTDLNMRKGKMIAQGAHAAVMSVLRYGDYYETPVLIAWIESGMVKICVRAESETELDAIAAHAKDRGVAVHVVTDAGHTEFHGVPTKTCLALGPDLAEKIDAITGDLKLL